MQTFTKHFCIEHVHGSTQWNLCLFMHLLTLTNIPSPSGQAAATESCCIVGFLTGASIQTGIGLTHIHHWCVFVKERKTSYQSYQPLRVVKKFICRTKLSGLPQIGTQIQLQFSLFIESLVITMGENLLVWHWFPVQPVLHTHVKLFILWSPWQLPPLKQGFESQGSISAEDKGLRSRITWILWHVVLCP